MTNQEGSETTRLIAKIDQKAIDLYEAVSDSGAMDENIRLAAAVYELRLALARARMDQESVEFWTAKLHDLYADETLS